MEMEQMTQTGLVVASTKKGEMDLDLALKRVLACKPILARILKGVVEECSGMDAEEVEACIEGEVSVDRVLLGPGLTNSIIGEAQEDYQNGEGMVRYDIRTFLKVPSVSWADRIKSSLIWRRRRMISRGMTYRFGHCFIAAGWCLHSWGRSLPCIRMTR